MPSIKALATSEIVIKGSRFIAIGDRIESPEAFSVFFDWCKNTYPEATHYCYAYVIGPNQQHQKAYDDGEPARTAGAPLLELIKKKNLTDVALLVVRYYGGIKLGVGGLTRAYLQAGRMVLDKSVLVAKTHLDLYAITFAYEHLGGVEHYLSERGTILNKGYSEVVKYRIECDHSRSEELIAGLTDLTKGSLQIDHEGSTSTYR